MAGSTLPEPLAIVGAGCRLPGGINDLDGLWEALTTGCDLITSAPPGRFDPAWFLDRRGRRPGKAYTLEGGFLDDVAGFDAGYFGVAPREADRLDPQQRLMLEMTVEALDDAGIAPAELAGSDTAVFVGIFNCDYSVLQSLRPESMNAYSTTGWTAGNTANRVSYLFDFHGPSMSVDTACSSSLVALHAAGQAIRSGECRVALAAGVNVIVDPTTYVGLCQASMLSERGRCHTFSSNADGYVRGEGAGMVVLKSLSDAVADGDRIHALVLASGTNADGRTIGLSQPDSRSQEALLRAVHARAGIDPDELVYLEAHGTGTPVGDPAECLAIGRAIGSRRAAGNDLPIGSIKTNIGHLESAAGIAGLLKGMLVLRHGSIPPSLHGTPLNPAIDWGALRISPVMENRPTRPATRPVVGVSAFGFGGVNAHAVLAPSPPVRRARRQPRRAGPVPIVASGRTPEAAAEQALSLAERCEVASPEELYDIGYALCRRRALHSHRHAVMATGPEQAAAALREAAEKRAASSAAPGGVVFAFGGTGTQWPAMAADLIERDETFRACVRRIDRLISKRAGWSLLRELTAPEEASRLGSAEFGQPALFAVQVALAEVLAGYGVRPAAVFGHSVGEVAAAHVAGALSLEDAVLLSVERARAQERTAGLGKMAAAGLSAEEAAAEIARYDGGLELAAINSDRDVTVAGDRNAIEDLGERLSARGVFYRVLGHEFAFHSRAMDSVQAPLSQALKRLRPKRAHVPMVSTVTAEPVDGPDLDAGYWWRNVRRPVLFGPAAERLAADGHSIFLEVGPHPALQPYLRRAGSGVAVAGTLRRGQDGEPAVREAAAALIAFGGEIDWDVSFPDRGRIVSLPPYPWQRTAHWNGAAEWWSPPLDHPLLGARTAALEPTWLAPLDPARVPWLGDHVVSGSMVVPAAAFVEMALAAGRLAHGGQVEVTALDVARPLAVPSAEEPQAEVQVSVSDEDGVVRIASRAGPDGEWRPHARTRVHRHAAAPPPALDLAGLRERLGTELDGDEHYARADRMALSYGPAFRVIRSVHIGDGEALAEYRDDAPHMGYEASPGLVDGALQAVLGLLWDARDPRAYLPVFIERVRLWSRPPVAGLIHVTLRSHDALEASADMTLTDQAGAVVMEITGCRMRRMPGEGAPPRHVTVLRAAPRPGTRSDCTGVQLDVARIASAARIEPRDVPAGLADAINDMMADRGPGLYELLREYPGHSAELMLAARAGHEITDDLIEHFYENGPLAQPYRKIAARALGEIVAAWPEDRPLRILEPGAGTGGLTTVLLPTLPPERTRYVFTDVSPDVLARAATRFAEYDFAEFHALDLERDPAEQGFGPAEFDIVVASNALHLVSDPRRAVERVASLLDRGGYLLLDEFFEAGPFARILGGTLRSAGTWTEILAGTGFSDVAPVRSGAEGDGLDRALLVARRATEARPEPAPSPTGPARRWMIITESAEDEPLAAAIGGGLRRHGHAVSPDGTADDTVFVLGGEHAGAGADPGESAKRVVAATATLREIAQSLRDVTGARLWLVARPTGAFPAPERPMFPGDAAVWGVARCLANEEPGLSVRRVSFEPEADVRHLLAELLSPDDPAADEVVLTRGGRFVPKVMPAEPGASPGDGPVRLRLTAAGPAYRLSWRKVAAEPPGPGEVSIEVRACGLNYRNVMKALGLLPADSMAGEDAEELNGFDCAGVVTGVGSGVTVLRPGDRVYTLTEAGMGSHVTVDAGLTARIPPGMDFEAAATLSYAFMTARMGLEDAGRLVPGETVLIHAAMGGVGLAAIQHARHIGATVIATAGSEEKRALLRRMGVEHVFDSRSLTFADEIRVVTGGRGVDVVLNSLAGAGLARGLEVLAPGGRFVELGKRDTYGDGRLALRPLRRNATFCVVDVKDAAKATPERAHELMREIAELVDAGVYRPLPYRARPVRRIAEAFGQLRRSRHVGKLVISFDPASPGSPACDFSVDPTATYLITGGLAGFGAEAARWLARRGARHLTLTGRSGAASPEAQETVRALEAMGVKMTSCVADVTDSQRMGDVIAAAEANGHPLGGVVHAAAVQDDVLLAELSDERFRRVLDPKLAGLATLDRLTRQSAGAFVAFSSVSATAGNPGQAAYCAGNLYAEALVRARRARGQAGLAVAWGAVGDAGYLTRNTDVEKVVSRWSRPLRSAAGLDVLGELLDAGSDVAVVGRIDWDAARTVMPALGSDRFSHVRTHGVAATSASRPDSIESATEAVTHLLAGVLQAAPNTIEPHREIATLGLDSLMMTELQASMWRNLGCDVPIVFLSSGTTVAALSERVLSLLRGADR